MEFGSLFAGIRGFDLALTGAGMRSVYAAEREADCNSVARRHFPDEVQIDDVTAVRGSGFGADIICAGWPCQGNSVAGRRAGMADERSGLWWEVVRILAEQRPRWFLGENVPGLLSVNGGRDFGAVLGSLAQLGYGTAYRVLDAQWCGVPQRRRRVFIVGCLSDWRSAAEILFERESLPWHPAPRRKKKSEVAGSITRRIDRGGVNSEGNDGHLIACTDVASTLDTRQSPNGHGARGPSLHETLVPDVAYAINTREGQHNGASQDTMIAYAIQERAECENVKAGPGGKGWTEGVSYTLEARSVPQSVSYALGVRRLMPIECERLQGFPDGWTEFGANGEAIADAARYRMLGNAVAVPAVEWIGRRIVAMEESC